MSRHVDKVATAVESELPWFDAFATPEASLDSLSRPDRNVRREGARVEIISDYLRSVGIVGDRS